MKDIISFLHKKRDIVSKIKKKGRNKKNRDVKNKFALIVEDEFGFRRIEYYFCTEKKIQKILFKKYISLKMKASNSVFEEEMKNFIVVKTGEIYKVRLKVGYTLFHTIYYEKINEQATHIVTKVDMNLNYYLGYLTYTEAIKTIQKVICKDFHNLCSNSKSEDENETCSIKKVFSKKFIKMKFTYWYRCNFEYEEEDTSYISVKAERLKFKKV